MFEPLFERPGEAARLAAAMERLRAVEAGEIVAWLGLNSLDLMALLAACEQRGAVLLPLNTRLAEPELGRILHHAGAAHLLHDDAMADAAQPLGRHLGRGPADGIEPGDLLLVYTSGTTGEPRGALHTVSGLQANADAAIASQGLSNRSRVLATLPMFHVGGLCIQTLPAWLLGAALRIEARFDPDRWFDAVETWRPTTTLLVPAVMRALIGHPRWASTDLSSLEFVNSGSQIVPTGLIEAFHARGIPVAQVYGSTETGPVSIVLPADEAMARVGQAGRAAPGVQVTLADDGEIRLRAPNLMRCYHRSADTGFDADGWFATGDLAREVEPGWFEIVGRRKELIISGGENIHPAEIESLLADHPDVAECAVVGLPDERWGEVPVLAVVRRAGAVPDAEALLATLDGRVARFKRPRQVVWIDQLPRTALGKVQRQKLVSALQGASRPGDGNGDIDGSADAIAAARSRRPSSE
jgi:fatty-acyl-CoA synthase